MSSLKPEDTRALLAKQRRREELLEAHKATKKSRTARKSLQQRSSTEASSIELTIKEQAARQTAADSATCRLTRKTPEPGRSVRNAWYLWEALVRFPQITFTVFALMEVSGDWSQGAERWRIYIFTMAVLYAVWWLATVMGAGFGAMNEKYYADKDLEGASDAQVVDWAEQMPACNFPPLRFGMLYITLIAGGLIIDTIYLHLDIVNDGIDLSISKNLRREMRVKVWIFIIVMVLDLVVALADYMELLHVGMDSAERQEKACGDVHCTLEGVHDDYPEIHPYVIISTLAEYGLFGMAVGGIMYLLQQLTLGPDSFWAASSWRLFSGIAAIFLGIVVFFSLVAMVLSRNHKCMYRSTQHAFIYWAVIASGVFTVWYRLQVFINTDKRDLTLFSATADGLCEFANDTPDMPVYENYLWMLLLFFGMHAWFVLYHRFKCYVNVVVQMAFCPKVYGW